ncbi:hypothetical protein [Paeniglutamicibacter sp. NPDC091659]|uniref:hypothetical protein n=1 Tax=Paeniglutamicibacter sp. NPDC091659 TaxID=3364389 RepID=UPI0037F6E189
MSVLVTGRSLAPKGPIVRSVAIAIALAVMVIGVGAVGGSTAMSGITIPGEPGVRAGLAGANNFGEVFLAILARNLPAAASLAAGIITFGLLSAVSGLFLGLYLGATIAASVNTVGVGDLFESVGAYVGIEMLGLAAAAVAGFLPLAYTLAGGRGSGRDLIQRYRTGLVPAAFLIALSIFLILVGAGIETVVITSSGSPAE